MTAAEAAKVLGITHAALLRRPSNRRVGSRSGLARSCCAQAAPAAEHSAAGLAVGEGSRCYGCGAGAGAGGARVCSWRRDPGAMTPLTELIASW